MTTAAAPPPPQDGSSMASPADQQPPLPQSPDWPLTRSDQSSSSTADGELDGGGVAAAGDKDALRPELKLPLSSSPPSLPQPQRQDDPERALPPVGAGETDAQLSSASPGGGQKRPWWKTRKALAGYAGGFVLLVFVVLLVLGLLGYLRKVGPLSALGSKSPTASTSSAPNPLTTIPLMSDPFALPPATPVPTSTATVVQTAVPTQTIQPVRINLLRKLLLVASMYFLWLEEVCWWW